MPRHGILPPGAIGRPLRAGNFFGSRLVCSDVRALGGGVFVTVCLLLVSCGGGPSTPPPSATTSASPGGTPSPSPIAQPRGETHLKAPWGYSIYYPASRDRGPNH